MRKRAVQIVLMVFVVVAVSGCIDDRIKRQADLLDAKTKVAKKEYTTAKTPEEKVKVADEYFRNADQMTDVLSAYMHGRKPTDPPATVDVPVPPAK